MDSYVLYVDGKLQGGIKSTAFRYEEHDHDEMTVTLYSGEVWRTYGPYEYVAGEHGGSYYLDGHYSWRV